MEHSFVDQEHRFSCTRLALLPNTLTVDAIWLLAIIIRS